MGRRPSPARRRPTAKSPTRGWPSSTSCSGGDQMSPPGPSSPLESSTSTTDRRRPSGSRRGRTGPSPFTIVAGREPATADEVVLGTSTSSPGLGTRTLVTGSSRTPVARSRSWVLLRSRASARLTTSGRHWAPAATGSPSKGSARHGRPKVAANAVLVTGADVGADELASRLRVAVGEATVISRDTGPGRSRRGATSVRSSVLLAALLVLMAMASLAHAVVLSARSRRHDLAVWRALGLRPRVRFGDGLAECVHHRFGAAGRRAARSARRCPRLGHD